MAIVGGTYHWDEHPMVPHNQDDGNGHTDTQPNDNQEPQDKIAVVETNVVEPGNAQIGDVSIGIDSNNNYFYTMFLFNGWNDWLPINYVGDNPVLEATINNLINEHQERTAIETQEALAERQQTYDTVMEREREHRESEEPNYIRIVGEQQNSMPFTGDTQIGIDSQHFYYCRRYLSEDIGWSEWIRPEQAPHTTRITVNNLIERHQNESQVEPQPTENHAAQDLTEGITNATRNVSKANRRNSTKSKEKN